MQGSDKKQEFENKYILEWWLVTHPFSSVPLVRQHGTGAIHFFTTPFLCRK